MDDQQHSPWTLESTPSLGLLPESERAYAQEDLSGAPIAEGKKQREDRAKEFEKAAEGYADNAVLFEQRSLQCAFDSKQVKSSGDRKKIDKERKELEKKARIARKLAEKQKEKADELRKPRPMDGCCSIM